MTKQGSVQTATAPTIRPQCHGALQHRHVISRHVCVAALLVLLPPCPAALLTSMLCAEHAAPFC
jgi:hypothetical protein